MKSANEQFEILVGTDGSRPASLAVDAVVHIPWPEPSAVHGVVSSRRADDFAEPEFRAILERAAHAAADPRCGDSSQGAFHAR